MSPLVSVIIPVYNIGCHLQNCFKSISNQTYNKLEILIVNDGSTDDTLKICKQLAESDNRVCIIDKENGGVSSARNAGLDNAHGEYIAFIDGDDIVAPIYIEQLLLGCKDNILSVCMHERIYTYTHSFQISDNQFGIISAEKCAEEVLTGHFPINIWACIFLHKSIGELRFQVGIRNNEDKLFLYKFLLNNINETIAITNNKMYGYYVRKESATRTTWDGSLDIIHVADEIYDMTYTLHSKWEPYAKLSAMTARFDTLKAIIQSTKQSQKSKKFFSIIRTQILNMGFPTKGSCTLKTEYAALKIGKPFFVILVKTYYLLMNDERRFKRNERRIRH